MQNWKSIRKYSCFEQGSNPHSQLQSCPRPLGSEIRTAIEIEDAKGYVISGEEKCWMSASSWITIDFQLRNDKEHSEQQV
jgi:hypothetical protein